MTHPSMDLDWPCTKEKPIWLSIRALAYLFSIAYNADNLVDAVLSQKPIAEHVRLLTVDLYELRNNIAGGLANDCIYPYVEALRELKITNAELVSSIADDVGLKLWTEEPENG